MYVKRHASPVETVTIHLDGAAIAAPRGETLAAVLLARGALSAGGSRRIETRLLLLHEGVVPNHHHVVGLSSTNKASKNNGLIQ
jgi:hypothetical protein